MELPELKSSYNKLSEIYSLPEFKLLNETFEIERIDRDSDILLRRIRKMMMDRIIGYARFMEMLINPSQTPFPLMTSARSMGSEIKEIVNKVYRNFVELELNSLKEEVEYNEQQEAVLILKIYNNWISNLPDLKKIMESIEAGWVSEKPSKKERNYFG